MDYGELTRILSLNGMNINIPITKIDDFLKYPDYVRELALNCEYNEPGYNLYPGSVSKNIILNIDKDLNRWITEKISLLFYGLTIINITCDFHKILPYKEHDHIRNKGLIHKDIGTNITAVVYLNKDPSINSGTSFYKTIKNHDYLQSNEYLNAICNYHNGKEVSDLDNLLKDHYNKFKQIDCIQNKYNQMSIYPADIWHAPTTYGKVPRYTLRFFINYDMEKG